MTKDIVADAGTLLQELREVRLGREALQLVRQIYLADPVLSENRWGQPNGLRIPGDGLDWRERLTDIAIRSFASSR